MKISDLVVEGQDKDAKPTHKVTVTFSEPNNATVSKRNDIRTQKATAQADDKDSAIERIKKHYTKAGYKVHDIKHDGLKEEIEEIVELSKNTLGSYNKKAAVSLAVGGIKMGRDTSNAVIRDGEKTVTKRIKGINRATDKLTKEEVELEEALSDAARELVVHGDNDSHLFHSSREPIIANLKQKVAKGTYDHEKAKKLWSHHADRTAQSYAKEHGDSKTPWHKQFTTADRKQAASHFADQARDEHLNEEQLDELSKDTLASYEKKSRVAAHKHALASELKGLAADPAGSYAHKQMADKRHAGWKVAVKKLNTEESDQLPSRKPFGSVFGSAKDQAQSLKNHLDAIEHTHQIAQKLKAKKEKEELGEEVEEEVDESSAHKLLANKLRNMYLLKKGAGDATRPAVVSTKKPIGSRVADIGPGGKEYNVKTDKAWDDTQKEETELEEEPATRELCQSSKPDDALGASQLSSCKSQGYRAHTGGKSHKIGSDRVHVNRKKIKGKKYGGPLPDWS